MAETAKFLAFSCVHAPLHDEEAIEWLCERIKEYRPTHIICLGDLHEAAAASKWYHEHEHDLLQEFKTAQNLLKPIRKSAPRKTTCIFLQGNHDANILEEGRIDKGLRSLCDYRSHQFDGDNEWWYWHHAADYIYCKKRGTYKLGQVTFSHGYETASCENEALKMTHEYDLYVHGHTHRPFPVTRIHKTKRVPLRHWIANTGCLAQMDNGYMKRKDQTLWGQGCVVGEASLFRGIKRSKEWDAEMLLFRTYGEHV